MAPRASWKGYLKLSLVSCPVRLYPATSASERVALQPAAQGHPQPDQHEAGRPRARARRALGPGARATSTRTRSTSSSRTATSRRCSIESNHTLNIEAFVDEDEVDVIYQDTPYYLAPDGAMAEETFIVLREAMREAGKVAIARLVLSSRERVVTIGAARQGHVRLHPARPERGARDRGLFRRDPRRRARRRDAGARRGADRAEDDEVRSQGLRGSLRGRADGDDQGEAQGPQADHRGRARARQRRQPDGRAEGEPRPGQAAGAEPEQGAEPAGREAGRRRPPPRRRRGGTPQARGQGARRDGCRRPDLRHRRGARGLPAAAGGARGRAAAAAGCAAASARRTHARGASAARCSARPDAAAIEARVDAERAAGRRLLSENGFLRLLGLAAGAGRRRHRAAVAARPVAGSPRATSTCWRSSTPSSTTPSPIRSAT